ncbi:hypothetical protein A9Q84_02775 [Halobacteriovorax marinus]|uniref:Uncharacterized protein n=1 Tax=Halobacteriovorax marinus TaxID=97084 RepID=A0A1Y5FCW1_9BACT|nr:hypothetical protein A9Q84_02775 [Halobacteriovorax marinus]
MANKIKVLFYEPRLDFLHVYCLNIMVYTDAKIIICSDQEEALAICAEEDLDFIIINNSSKKNKKKDISYHLNNSIKHSAKRPNVLLIGGAKCDYENFEVKASDSSLKDIIKFIASHAQITAKEMSELWTKKYYPIPIHYLLPGWQTTKNLYEVEEPINIGKPTVRAGEIIQNSLLEEYRKEGRENLYVNSAGRLDLVNSFSSSILETLSPDSGIDIRRRNLETSNAYEMVSEQVRSIGVTETSLELAKASITSMEKMIDELGSMKALYEQLREDELSLRYRHGLVTAFVATHLLNQTDWGHKQQRELITYMAFFHDMVLTEDYMLKFEHDKDVMDSDLPDIEKSIIVNHARLAAKIISSTKGFPSGLDVLIKQHHGCKMGDSLHKISMNVSPLAIIFVLSEEWTNLSLEAEELGKSYTKDKIIRYLKRKYEFPNFMKLIHLLDQLNI